MCVCAVGFGGGDNEEKRRDEEECQRRKRRERSEWLRKAKGEKGN